MFTDTDLMDFLADALVSLRFEYCALVLDCHLSGHPSTRISVNRKPSPSPEEDRTTLRALLTKAYEQTHA